MIKPTRASGHQNEGSRLAKEMGSTQRPSAAEPHETDLERNDDEGDDASSLDSQVENLSRQLMESREEIGAMESKIRQAKIELFETQSRCKKLKDTVDSNVKVYERQQARMEALRQRDEKVTTENEALKKENLRLQTLLEAARNENRVQALTARIQQLEADNDILQRKYDIRKKEIQASQRVVVASEQDLTSTQLRRREVEASNATLKEQLREAKETIENLNSCLKSAENRNSEVEWRMKTALAQTHIIGRIAAVCTPSTLSDGGHTDSLSQTIPTSPRRASGGLLTKSGTDDGSLHFGKTDTISDSELCTVAMMGVSSGALNKLCIDKLTAGEKGARILAECIADDVVNRVHHLALSGAGLHGPFMRNFTPGLRSSILTFVSLSSAGLGDEDISNVVAGLQGHPALRTLILKDNEIANDGALLLAGLLSDTAGQAVPTLHELNLHCNRIEDSGACAIAAELGGGRPERLIRLSRNPIGSRGQRTLLGLRDIGCKVFFDV